MCTSVSASVGLLLGAQTGQVMQAFFKGASGQTTKTQREKAGAGNSTEKKAKAVPWVEK